MSKNGHIWFRSETPVETIEAHNYQVNSALNTSSGDYVFKVLIKSFEFEKALMKEHFNENYLESDEFPLATYTGKIINYQQIDFSKQGKVNIITEGKLLIHGKEKFLRTNGVFSIEGTSISCISGFWIEPKDFEIKIPGVVVKNIAEKVLINIDVKLEKLIN